MATPKLNGYNGDVQQPNISLPIIFIDPEVDNIHSMVNGVIPGGKVVTLQANRDWVEQITETLTEHHGVALALDQPVEPISVKMIFRGLYHVVQAAIRSYSYQIVTHFVENHKRLGLLKAGNKKH